MNYLKAKNRTGFISIDKVKQVLISIESHINNTEIKLFEKTAFWNAAKNIDFNDYENCDHSIFLQHLMFSITDITQTYTTECDLL